MPSPFSPRLDVLPPPQRRLWNELTDIPPEFVLYGGTAVALRLGHRQSADFDFFGDRALNADDLTLAIPLLAGATVTQREPNTLSCIVDRGGPVKLSFFGLPSLRRLRLPSIAPDNRLRIASLFDLAGRKASVVQMRAEAKDYTDIDAILVDGRIDLPTMLACALAIHGSQFNPQVTLKALSFFDDGDLRRLSQDLRERLARAIRGVDLDRLPEVAAEDAPDGGTKDPS